MFSVEWVTVRQIGIYGSLHMAKLIFVSGACGCGKSTFADTYGKYLVEQSGRTVYIIHGDDFHRGFIEPKDKGDYFFSGETSEQVQWKDILQFNWDCIINTADRALRQGLDVIIDYVIEEELPRVQELAHQYCAEFYYIVLTAAAEEIERRIRKRGDLDLIDRALFLKKKLDALPENQGHLYDNTYKSLKDSVNDIVLTQYLVRD